MKIDLMDVERLIRTNGLEGKEVTNPILFEAGNIPTPDGNVVFRNLWYDF